MDPAAYLEAIRDDAAALAAAARLGLEAAVPSCPGWTVADVVAHTGAVHRQKEQIVRERWTDGQPEPVAPPDAGLVEWFEVGAAEMLQTFENSDPATAVSTWHPADQSVGFWYRRMAHETAIHRVDAQLAFGPVTPVAAELAADGVDEIITVMIEGAPPWAEVTPGEAVLRVETTDVAASWTLRETTWSGTSPRGNVYDDEDGFEFTTAAAANRLSGEASDVLLYLWGRGPLDRLPVAGDVAIVHTLRRVAAEATG